MYVCLCHGVTDSEIRDAAAAGCTVMPELMMRTGCGSNCGCCIETASALLEDFQAEASDAAVPAAAAAA